MLGVRAWGLGFSDECNLCIYSKSLRFCAAALALAAASDTERIAFAPSLALLSVPSIPIILVSSFSCSTASKPFSSLDNMVFTFSTALRTPLPRYFEASPSRSSIASLSPVEAPEGTAARPMTPFSSSTSHSTVGLPRESRICRAWIDFIFIIERIL